MTSLGSISSHTRPIECIDGRAESDGSAILYTGDTMGVIKVWDLRQETGPEPRWKAFLIRELITHRTRINEMLLDKETLWTG
jgi:hypothetical protein